MHTRPSQVAWIVFLCLYVTIFAASADDSIYRTEISFIGGEGSTSTNAAYTMVSSWRQPTQTSIASGGPYDHASGLLGALSDIPVAFRIVAFGVATNPAPRFQITVPTQLGHRYLIQYADTLSAQPNWAPFLNTNQSVGTYLATNAAPANFTFTDDFTAATSGGPSASSTRIYRVIASQTSPTP